MDRRFGAVSVVMQVLYQTVAMKKELGHKVKLSIYQSIYVLTLTYGCELLVLTERIGSRIQAAEMRFVWGVAGLSLRDWLKSEDWREVGGSRESRHLIRIRPINLGARPWGRPRTDWRDYISCLAWECLGAYQGELQSIGGEREAWNTLLSLLPLQHNFR